MFCYVILHYLTLEDTINCVESILKQGEECRIIVVDNASNNGSIEQIENRYKDNCSVIIIKNNSNLGFASGNNVGYEYARTQCKADFIAVSNNDIIVDTENFVSKVRALYAEKPFGIAGPDIISVVDSQHQNPMIDSLEPTPKAVGKLIQKYTMLLWISKLGLYDVLKRNGSSSGVHSGENQKGNKQLHGAFIIFSPKYIQKEKYAFRPGTFLYMEESILYQYCQKNGYKMRYLPELLVYHKEDSSTNALCGATKAKREFVFKNMIHSLKVYKNLLDNSNQS